MRSTVVLYYSLFVILMKFTLEYTDVFFYETHKITCLKTYFVLY